MAKEDRTRRITVTLEGEDFSKLQVCLARAQAKSKDARAVTTSDVVRTALDLLASQR